jgi:AraC-like DNA-binding protein
VDHIIANYKNEITVSNAADIAGMTEATFSRNFQAVTGHRFVEFVNSVRIGKACGMLYASDDPVMSICHQAGFNNIANFNRHFLKLKGMTPTTYRETAREDLFPEAETTE